MVVESSDDTHAIAHTKHESQLLFKFTALNIKTLKIKQTKQVIFITVLMYDIKSFLLLRILRENFY